MSRTQRRGLNKDGDFDFVNKTAHDWSCGNPFCCGGEAGRKSRRRERSAMKSDLRRDPEGATTTQSARSRKGY